MPRLLIILLSILPALIVSGKAVTAIEIVDANDVRTCLRHVSPVRSNEVSFCGEESDTSVAEQVKRRKATSVQYYLYDHAGRLTRAEAKLENTGVDYTQEMEYDLNANVTAMRRYGAINAREGALLDDLTIEYQGNRMEFVTDDAEAYPYEASLDFRARAPIASTPGASVAAPFSLLGSLSESPDGLTPNPVEPYNPLNPYNYAADFAYDANGNMTQDRHSAITAITYNVLNLPTQVLYEGLANNRPVSEMVYDASGRKHIVRNGVKKLGAFSGDVTRYVGDYIIVNDTVDRLQTPYGYLRDGEFHSYVFDYQGNVMVVVSGDKVDQTNLYYADGLPMNVSTDATANRFKYSAKELSLFRGLPVYDYTARHTLPQLSNTFRTMDRECESFFHLSPYSYCGGDPINFIDPTGRREIEVDQNGNILKNVNNESDTFDSVTVVDNKGDIVSSVNVPLNSVNIIEHADQHNTIEYQIEGEDNAQKVFETLAQSKVEYSFCVTNNNGQESTDNSKSQNFITTTHQSNAESKMINYIFKTLSKDYTIQKHTHSHPNNTPYPSNFIENNKPSGDIPILRNLMKNIGYDFETSIYLPGKDTYIKFDPKDKKYDK